MCQSHTGTKVLPHHGYPVFSKYAVARRMRLQLYNLRRLHFVHYEVNIYSAKMLSMQTCISLLEFSPGMALNTFRCSDSRDVLLFNLRMNLMCAHTQFF